MRKIIISIVALSFLTLLSFGVLAQNPPHPNGGGAPGSGNTPVGGGAPLGEGLAIMMVLGAVYGSKKIHNTLNEK